MPAFMLARLKLRYGFANLPRYDTAMKGVREFFEAEGIMLEQALVTTVGPLYEVWNLWRIDDANHLGRATARLGDDAVFDRYAEVLATLSDIVIEEDLRFLETMPFFLAAPARAEPSR